jgi:hypothetical protein
VKFPPSSYAEAVYGVGNKMAFCYELLQALSDLMEDNKTITPDYIDETVQLPKSFGKCEDWMHDSALFSPLMFAYIQFRLQMITGIRLETPLIDKDVASFVKRRNHAQRLSREWVSKGLRSDPGFSWAHTIFAPLPPGMKSGWMGSWVSIQLSRAKEYMTVGWVVAGSAYDHNLRYHNSAQYPVYAATFVFCSMCLEVQNMLRRQTR